MHTQLRFLAKFLYTHNPFYLISACLVLYGLQTAFRDGNSIPEGAWLLASALCGYTVLLAVTAFLVVRFGKVWEDGRSLALLVVLMFIAISVSFDGICNTFPATAATVLTLGLVLSVGVTESLVRSLRIKLPLEYRFPLYLMLALFFLYPLWVSPYLTDQLDNVIAWRVFQFPIFAGLIILTLIPAVRRGSVYLKDNGTPWNWPWYPWPIFVFLALGVCGRSFVLTFTFQAAMEWPAAAPIQPSTEWASSFGLYYLMPFFFAILVLLAEIGLVERSPKLLRAVMVAVPFLILTAVPIGSGKPFDDFLGALVSRIGSPIWLSMLAATAFYGHLWQRGVRAAEMGLCSFLVALSFVGRETIGVGGVGLAQWWPLAALGAFQLERTFPTRSSIRCLGAVVSLTAAACVAFQGTWFTAIYGLLPLHVVVIALLPISILFSDRFSLMLRRFGAFLPMLLGVTAVGVGPILEVPVAFTLLYLIGLACLATACWLVTRFRIWQLAVVVNAIAGFLSAGVWLHWGLQAAIPIRALTALTWGGVCFFLAALISGMKGGLAKHARVWFCRERRAILNEWRE